MVTSTNTNTNTPNNNKRVTSSSVTATGKRARGDKVETGSTAKRLPLSSNGKGGEKALKGLRHFSMKVCKKVEEKGQTSYNEVADELVQEFLTQNNQESKDSATAYDEKNIRRRVYDALNVLMAMDIISKEKKEIKWKGLPNNANHDLEMLQQEKERCMNSIKQKREGLHELLVQQVCFRNLVKRNKNLEEASTAKEIHDRGEHVHLPFIVVNTSSNAVIQCEMNADRTDVMFDFSMPFEIKDDVEILKRLGLGKIDKQELGHFIPHDLLQYCEDQRLLDSVLLQSPFTSSVSDSNHLSSVAAAAAAVPQAQASSSSSSSHYYSPPSEQQQQQQQRFSSPPDQHNMSTSSSYTSSTATYAYNKREC